MRWFSQFHALSICNALSGCLIQTSLLIQNNIRLSYKFRAQPASLLKKSVAKQQGSQKAFQFCCTPFTFGRCTIDHVISEKLNYAKPALACFSIHGFRESRGVTSRQRLNGVVNTAGCFERMVLSRRYPSPADSVFRRLYSQRRNSISSVGSGLWDFSLTISIVTYCASRAVQTHCLPILGGISATHVKNSHTI